MRLAGEPSIDEILSSIKKVIARDDRAQSADRHHDGDGAAAGPDHDDVLDLAVAGNLVIADQPPELPTEAAPLVTPASRAAMRESLAALTLLAEPPASPRTNSSSENALEELVRELLRPALAEWLDRHLPAMVEKLVAREIARIVGQKS